MKHQTNHQKPKRITAGILALLLLLSSAILTGYAETLTAGETVQGAFLEAELLAAMAAASDTDLLPVAIWLEPIDVELVEAIALEQTGLNKQAIRDMAEAGTDGQLTAEQVDAYIAAERSVYAKLQSKANEAFLSSKASVLSKNFDQRDVFVSAYSPMIVAEMTKGEIATFAHDTRIQSMAYVGGNRSINVDTDSDILPMAIPEDPENYPKDPAQVIHADFYRDKNVELGETAYTGLGVKIGQIELATPNRNELYFIRENIICRDGKESYGANSDKIHANAVAAIMVARHGECLDDSNIVRKYEGIAPNAKLYCTAVLEEDPNNIDFYENTEWLLSQGVHVINMSAGDAIDVGIYAAASKWIDHLAINHSVHFVNSSGNIDVPDHPDTAILDMPDPFVTQPAMSYNAIAVGAANYTINARASFSCYMQNQTQCANKPDLVALGEYVITAPTVAIYDLREMTRGTSFAAPAVTGAIAQILEAKPSLRVLQDALKAVLTASVSSSILRFTTSAEDEAQFDECGAGLIDAKVALETAMAGDYLTSSFASSAIPGATRIHTFTVDESDSLVRVSLTWLKNNRCSASHILDPTEYALSNLNLTIYDSNYNIVASSSCTSGNLEIVEFVPESGGQYVIVISYFGDSLSTTYYGVSWW